MLTYNIFDDALELRNLVDNFFSDYPVRGRNRQYPYTELYEGSDGIEIHAIMPGVKAEDLDIQLVDDTLLIEGEKKNDYTDNPYIRREREFGKFKKTLKLPYRVEANKVKADLKNGILVIKLEKSENAKPRRITIQ